MYVRVCACVGQTLFCPMRGASPAGTEDVPPPPLENGDSRTKERSTRLARRPQISNGSCQSLHCHPLPALRRSMCARALSHLTRDAAGAFTQAPPAADANLLRNPEQCGFRVLQPGAVRDPQFGYLFLESRRHEARRPRLLDGLDWVPSSAANASSRVLHDGVTELVRNYCARRTKSEAARPQIRPFVEFQRSVNDEVKQQYPQASALDHKTIVGRMWRAMPSAEKEAYKAQAAAKNRNARQRMAAAQPQELLVRHEMWLQLSDLWTASDPPFDGACSERLLLHYLGDDAWHCLSCPPDAIGIVTDPWVPSTPSPWRSIGSGMRTTGPQAPQLVLSYSDQGEARPAPQVVHAIPLVAGQQAEPGAPTVPSFASLHQLGPSTSPALTVAASCEDADLAAHFGSGASFGGTGASFGGGAGGSAIDYGIAGASFGSPASFGGLAGLSAAGSFGTTALDQFLFQVQSGDPFHDDDGFSPLQSLATHRVEAPADSTQRAPASKHLPL